MNNRRRLPLGFYPDRGISDPITIDIDATIASGGSYAQIPIPNGCQLVITAAAWGIADVSAGGDAVLARTFACAVRRDSAGVTAVTSPHALTATGAMTATPAEAVIVGGPTGLQLDLSCAFTVASLARIRARLSILAIPVG